MGKAIRPISIQVSSEKGKVRLAEDLDRKEQIKLAIQKREPAKEIEAKFGIKFVTPV